MGMGPQAIASSSLFLAVAMVVVLAFISAAPTAAAADSPSPTPPYSNYTVGGPAGWSFDTVANKSAVDYSSWASNHSFFLGDFLIFQTNPNTTVIQTYNKTTYDLCSLDEDYGNLTTEFTNGADGSDVAGGDIAVALTNEGDNYYFSSADDGIQCQNGMRFHILVAHGNGLPPGLSQPPPPPSSTASPPSSAPFDATTSSQNERFYNAGGGGPTSSTSCLVTSMLFGIFFFF